MATNPGIKRSFFPMLNLTTATYTPTPLPRVHTALMNHTHTPSRRKILIQPARSQFAQLHLTYDLYPAMDIPLLFTFLPVSELHPQI